jgi:hypothetical protein
MSAMEPSLHRALRAVQREWKRTRGALSDSARVARFLRGALEFRVRADDVFLSSYPRSGTTWLQHVLHVLAHDGDSGCAHISDVAPWYERSLALGVARAADFERLPSPRLFKSHLPYAWLPRGARYVYALRDGRDVAVSYHQLYRSHLGSGDDFDTFFERFVHGRLQYGSWFDHVAGWRAHAGRPDVLLVQYEALHRDLPAVMRELSAFCAWPHNDARIAELAALCRFDVMKREEHRFDHATERTRAGASGMFLRVGQPGGHREVLSPAQDARFDAERARCRRGPQPFQLSAFLH